jgi:hypothetical protein
MVSAILIGMAGKAEIAAVQVKWSSENVVIAVVP